MIQRICRRTGALLLLLGLVTTAPLLGQASSDSLDVLFIGNSYTYFNNLPGMIEAISRELGGPVVRQDSHTLGGYTLQEHLSDGHLQRFLADGGPTGDEWEFVVLQEQSMLGVGYADAETGRLGQPEGFRRASRGLGRLIREYGATPLFYMTWAKRRYPDQTGELAAAYQGIATELRTPVAPVGLAWARVRSERPELELFTDDGSHPSPAGSYLAACVFYSVLTGRSPLGAPSQIEGTPWNGSGLLPPDRSTLLVSLTPEVARYLQGIAWETVQAF